MKRKALFFAGILLIALLAAGAALAAPQQGLLVDENGDPLEGFSHVWIENGVAYPVYNPSTNLWYSVFIIGTDENGVFICVIGRPLGTDTGGPGGEGHTDDLFYSDDVMMSDDLLQQ